MRDDDEYLTDLTERMERHMANPEPPEPPEPPTPDEVIDEAYRGVTVTLDLNEILKPAGVDLQAIVLERVAAMAFAKLFSWDRDDDLWRARQDLAHRLAAIEKEEIRALVKGVLDAELTEDLVVTNTYGTQTEPVKTVKERIIETATRELSVPNRNSGGRTAMQEFIEAIVKGAVAKELRSALDEGKATITTVLRDQAAAMMAEAMRKAAGA